MRRPSIEPIHPGEHVAEELEALRMSAAALSRQLGVPTNRVTQILNGRCAITGCLIVETDPLKWGGTPNRRAWRLSADSLAEATTTVSPKKSSPTCSM